MEQPADLEHVMMAWRANLDANVLTVPYVPDRQRWFFYRDPARLREQLPAAGLQILDLTREAGSRDWLRVLARAA